MEMDIYMRRRLVALGGLVALFIIFVLLIRSCGDDEEPAPLQTTGGGTTGETGAVPLTLDEFIAEADGICGPANRQVGALDPTDPNATRDEFQITRQELQQLESLELEDNNRRIAQFLSLLDQVVAALRAKAVALDRNDTVTAEEAQVDIDTAEAEARALGEQIGFADCGQFLDAGQAPAAGGTGGTAGTDTTGTDTGETVVPTTETTTPPAETTTPPAETTTPPPADDSGGITP
jgi:hypothetical protein